MVRVTNAVASLKRKRRLFKRAKGYWGDRKNHQRLTECAVDRALAYNYKHRKIRKREMRSLWIQRISIATKLHGISYSKFIFAMKKLGSDLDRKMLSEMAIHDPASFAAVVENAKKALA